MRTITVIFPQVKINLRIDKISFSTIENMVFEITQRLGRHVIKSILQNIDNILRAQRPKGTLTNGGMRGKYFLTRLGDIRYKRRRYIDKETDKPRYLLEEHLGIEKNQRISLLRAKIELFIASIMPYKKTQENIELLTGYRRSHEAIRQSVIKEAERIVAHQEQSIEKTKRLEDDEEENAKKNNIVYVESDATFIRLQRRRKRKGRMYKIKVKRRRRKRRSIEVKLGIGYTDKVKRYKNGKGDSLRLKDKFVHVGISSGKKFMEDLSLIAERKLSISKAKALIFGGDGGSYITSGIRDYFVGAIYVLCKFHLKRNIKSTFCSRPAIQLKVNELLKKDEIDKVLSLMRRLIKRTKDRKKKEGMKDLYTYIDQNRKGINSIKRIKDKALRNEVKGAGAMEPNVDKFIAHRFKKRGMSWSVKGAFALLKIKETIENNEWDHWWSRQRDEKIDINPGPLRQLTVKDFWKREKGVRPLIEATIPALRGPDQNEPWAKVVRELQTIDYYK